MKSNFEMESTRPLMRMPLFQQLSKRIRADIHGRRAGDRIRPEAEYAKTFGVSVSTVRQALLTLEREGLIARRQGSGTFVCDPQPERKHVAVLLDVDICSDNLSPFFLRLMRELRGTLAELGMPSRPYLGDLPLGMETTGLTCRNFLDDVHLGRISGLISFFTHRSPEWTSLLESRKIPVIDPEYYRQDHLHPGRDQEFLHAAFQHLTARGKKRIALLVWESAIYKHHFFSESFRSLARDYGIRIDERFVDSTASGWKRGMGWERFRDIWRSQSEHPDGLIIGDDGLFADCQRAILEMNISVPEALEVVVRSSDAINLVPEIPVLCWRMSVRPMAQLYAREMKALLDDVPPPVIPSWPHVIERMNPANMDEDVPVQIQGSAGSLPSRWTFEEPVSAIL